MNTGIRDAKPPAYEKKYIYIYQEYLSFRRSRSKEISYNVSLTKSFSQRLSHNVFITTSFSQRLFHHFFLTTSCSQRHAYIFSHIIIVRTSCSQFHFHNIILTTFFLTISFSQRCPSLFLYICTYYFFTSFSQRFTLDVFRTISFHKVNLTMSFSHRCPYIFIHIT